MQPDRILIKEFLVDGPAEASHLFVFAHGAGVGMASPFMETVVKRVADAGIRVVRFHFPYMEDMVRTGQRRPPNGGRILRQAYGDVIRHCIEREHCPPERVVIGGKSMGGRIASMIADEHRVAGVVCLGYPFHPPRKPLKVRTEHLRAMKTPTLICQGDLDIFGTRADVASYELSPSIRLHWLAGGNHDFKTPRESDVTTAENMNSACAAVIAFIHSLPMGK